MPGACFDFEGAAWVDLADSIAVGGREYDLYQTSVDTRFPHLFLFVYRFHCPTGVRKESRECPVAMNGDAVAVDTINRRSCCAVSVVLMAQRRRKQYRQCPGACVLAHRERSMEGPSFTTAPSMNSRSANRPRSFALPDSTNIQLFAVISGDVNPAHVDTAFGAHHRFGHAVMQGMWTADLYSALLGTRLPGPDTNLPRPGVAVPASVRAG